MYFSDHLDLGIEEFFLKDASGAKHDVTVDVRIDFSLKVQIKPSGSKNFGSNGSPNYDAKFYLSTDPVYTPATAIEINYSFNTASQAKMKAAVTSDEEHTLSPGTQAEYLQVGRDTAGRFCDQKDVYVIVQVTNKKESNIDPNVANDAAAFGVRLHCTGGEYSYNTVVPVLRDPSNERPP